MKICFKCRIGKPLAEFYDHPATTDGKLGKCKDCTKLDVKENRETNIDRIRAYDRDRGNRQKPGYLQEYRKKYPLKYRAMIMINNAIRDKRIFKEACEKCKSLNSIHAHHDDYAKPLNVRWLCAAHHKQWHVENGEGLNAS